MDGRTGRDGTDAGRCGPLVRGCGGGDGREGGEAKPETGVPREAAGPVRPSLLTAAPGEGRGWRHGGAGLQGLND